MPPIIHLIRAALMFGVAGSMFYIAYQTITHPELTQTQIFLNHWIVFVAALACAGGYIFTQKRTFKFTKPTIKDFSNKQNKL